MPREKVSSSGAVCVQPDTLPRRNNRLRNRAVNGLAFIVRFARSSRFCRKLFMTQGFADSEKWLKNDTVINFQGGDW